MFLFISIFLLGFQILDFFSLRFSFTPSPLIFQFRDELKLPLPKIVQ